MPDIPPSKRLVSGPISGAIPDIYSLPRPWRSGFGISNLHLGHTLFARFSRSQHKTTNEAKKSGQNSQKNETASNTMNIAQKPNSDFFTVGLPSK